jgi:hypothetical protein
MTVDTTELRKIQYAQELAAYTMRQWMLMREDRERKRSFDPASANEPESPTQNLHPCTGRPTRDNANSMSSVRRPAFGWSIDICFSRTGCPRPYRALVASEHQSVSRWTYRLFSPYFDMSISVLPSPHAYLSLSTRQLLVTLFAPRRIAPLDNP